MAQEEILKILDTFGMKGEKAAEAMGITHSTFRSKKNENNNRHFFNAKNLISLKRFIIAKSKELEAK
jgi:hypothetical protein